MKKRKRINHLPNIKKALNVVLIVLVCLAVIAFSLQVSKNTVNTKTKAAELKVDSDITEVNSISDEDLTRLSNDKNFVQSFIQFVLNYLKSNPPTTQPNTPDTYPTPPQGSKCMDPKGCGGDCNKDIYQGCGYGGCQFWEECADDNKDGVYSCHDRTSGQDYWKMEHKPVNVCLNKINEIVPGLIKDPAGNNTDITVTPTIPGSTSPSVTVTPAKSNKPFVMVLGHFYNTHKPYLRSGDILDTIASRQYEESPVTANSSRFTDALKILKNADVGNSGIRKGIIFSSYKDAMNLVPLLPDDVTVVGYNMEGMMTPETERNDLLNSVRQFANVTKANGKYFIFAPINTRFRELENQGKLDDLLNINGLSAVGYQAQGIDGDRVGTIDRDYQTFKEYNPNVDFIVQLWYNRQSVSEMIEQFNEMEKNVDGIRIGTINQETASLDVMKGLNWIK